MDQGRARSFGAVADLYDRRRPGYPDALYDAVLGLTPGRRVLDVGAGTGRASVALARRGASVTAVEPDPTMAALLRRNAAGLPVDVALAPFEDCRVPPRTFDLVVAAQSWHWVDHERGAAVAAAALRPGGHLCLWWNRPNMLVGPLWDALEAVYLYLAPTLRPVVLGHPASVPGDDVPPAPGFDPWAYAQWNWTQVYGAGEFADLLDTHSDHALLPAEQRAELVAAVRRTIDDLGGGTVTYPYRTFLAHAALSR